MRKSVRRGLVVAALVVGVGVPGAAFASTSEVTADPQPSVQEPGPPPWAPEECQELWDSPEMEAWREEHRAEMQEHRDERQSEMRERHEQAGVGHRHGAGHGPQAGHMWEGDGS